MTEKQDENLWTKLQSSFKKTKKVPDAHLLVFGDSNSGKRSIINQLEQLSGERNIIESRNDQSVLSFMKDKKVAGAIDYRYYTVKNPDDENMELAKVNIWFVNIESDPDLLSLILNKEVMKNLMVMIVQDFECYWKIMDNLHKYMLFLSEKVLKHMKDVSLKESDEMKERLSTFVKNYIEPKITAGGKTLTKRSEIDPENWDSYTLPEGLQSQNFGFPVYIVLNKCEQIFEMRKSNEALEMIEYSVRNFALDSAASIFYTSTKMNTNLTTLYSYINYYFFQVPHYCNVNVSKDAQFIPSGFDNSKVLEETYPNVKDKMFEDIIHKPNESKSKIDRNKEQSLLVTQHQGFLGELQKHLGNSQEVTQGEESVKEKKPYDKYSRGQKSSGGQTAVPPNQTQKILAMLKEKKNMRSSEGTDLTKSTKMDDGDKKG